ncbi:hypothetical protein VNO78_20120 [Psophocarpus tetragonolobus]|uniref:Uncharacterized protein n=1 Tax=Psophocarpus tetragonolobus TaxID=3891 RepID=A0AAN9XGX2_PSOTE
MARETPLGCADNRLTPLHAEEMTVEAGSRLLLGRAEDLDSGAGPRGIPDSLDTACGTRSCCLLGWQVEAHSNGPCGARTGATVGLLAATDCAPKKRGRQQEMGLITSNHDGSGRDKMQDDK